MQYCRTVEPDNKAKCYPAPYKNDKKLVKKTRKFAVNIVPLKLDNGVKFAILAGRKFQLLQANTLRKKDFLTLFWL